MRSRDTLCDNHGNALQTSYMYLAQNLVFMMEVKRRQSITNSAAKIGVDQLKPEQMRALEAILSGKDTFVSLPTGYGKSIIFAALPLAFDELKGILFWSQFQSS